MWEIIVICLTAVLAVIGLVLFFTNRGTTPSPPLATMYSCNDQYQCVEDPNGEYKTLVGCQADCTAPVTNWSCNDQYQCVEDPDGQYKTLVGCQAQCKQPTPVTNYSCNDQYQCVEDPDGQYSSKSDCQADCTAPVTNWSCNDQYQCVEDPNGQYSSKGDCQADCTAPVTYWSCNDQYQCVEDPNGQYSSKSECQSNCTAPDPCAGVTCPTGQVCVDGTCVDPSGPTPQDVYDFMGKLPGNLKWANIDATTKIPKCWDTGYTESDAILKYFISWKTGLTSFRNCVDSSISTVDCSDSTFDLNPAYKWQGFQNAVFIWNTAIQRMNEICSQDGVVCDYSLGDTFAMESDSNLQKMTIAAFLANAVIESAYFMVCKESTQLNDATNTPCPGNKDDGTFNMRYCNNCDNANPANYSCFGGATEQYLAAQDRLRSRTRGYRTLAGTGFGDTPNPRNTACVTGAWVNHPCSDSASPDSLFTPAGCTAQVDPMDTNSNFKTDLCMSLWNLKDSDVNCTDWGGFKLNRQQDCYYGRGLIQLTWSGNYGQVQNWVDIVTQVFNYSDDWLKTQPQIIQDFAKNAANICVTPDLLCGNATYTDNGQTVVYSDSDVDNVMPWLTSLVYWANYVSPDWTTNYDFYTSMADIAPSGSSLYDVVGDVTTGTTPGRLDSYRILLDLFDTDPKSYQCQSNDSGQVYGCCTFNADCNGGGGSTGSWCVPDSTEVSGTSSVWMVADESQCIPCTMNDTATGTDCPDGYSKTTYCTSQLNVGDWDTFCT